MVRSGNLLLCLLVAVAGGARWAKMTDLGSGSFLSIQLPSSLLDGITCRVSVVVNAAITVLIKETAVMDALVRCQRAGDTLCAVTCSPFFHRKQQQRVHVRTAKREGAQGSDGRISVATKQHKQKLDRSGCVLGSLGLRHENIDARRAG